MKKNSRNIKKLKEEYISLVWKKFYEGEYASDSHFSMITNENAHIETLNDLVEYYNKL